MSGTVPGPAPPPVSHSMLGTFSQHLGVMIGKLEPNMLALMALAIVFNALAFWAFREVGDRRSAEFMALMNSCIPALARSAPAASGMDR